MNENNNLDTVAIIGMAGRFPKAKDIKEFQEHLEENHISVEFIKRLIPDHLAQIIPNQSLRIFQDSWNDYCVKPIKFYEIPGGHFSIFKEPNVTRAAAIIENAFNR